MVGLGGQVSVEAKDQSRKTASPPENVTFLFGCPVFWILSSFKCAKISQSLVGRKRNLLVTGKSLAIPTDYKKNVANIFPQT